MIGKSCEGVFCYLGSAQLLNIACIKGDDFVTNKLNIRLILLYLTIKWLKINCRKIWVIQVECQKNA